MDSRSSPMEGPQQTELQPSDIERSLAVCGCGDSHLFDQARQSDPPSPLSVPSRRKQRINNVRSPIICPTSLACHFKEYDIS